MYAVHSNRYHVAMLLTFFSLNCFCFMLPLPSNSLPDARVKWKWKIRKFSMPIFAQIHTEFILFFSWKLSEIVEINLQWKFFFLLLFTLVMCLLSLSTFHPSCISLVSDTIQSAINFLPMLHFLSLSTKFFLEHALCALLVVIVCINRAHK